MIAAFALMFVAGAIAGWSATIVYIAVFQPSWAQFDDLDAHP